jgi:hypothetical protein
VFIHVFIPDGNCGLFTFYIADTSCLNAGAAGSSVASGASATTAAPSAAKTSVSSAASVTSPAATNGNKGTSSVSVTTAPAATSSYVLMYLRFFQLICELVVRNPRAAMLPWPLLAFLMVLQVSLERLSRLYWPELHAESFKMQTYG